MREVTVFGDVNVVIVKSLCEPKKTHLLVYCQSDSSWASLGTTMFHGASG
jgi:hypothetical protein